MVAGLLVVSGLVATPASTLASPMDSSDAAAEQAAAEIQAARDRANAAADAMFDAESALDTLTLDEQTTALEVAELEAKASQLQVDVQEVAVQRFISGRPGIPLLGGLDGPTEQAQVDVLLSIITDTSQVSLDEYAAVADDLQDKRRQLAKAKERTAKAIEDYAMIGEGDKVMVCLSGGKDSYTMLDILLSLQRSAPVSFELVAVNLDQKQPDFPEDVLPNYLTALGVPHHIIEQDTYSVVKRVIPEGKTMCGLCSRMRRGALYRWAGENGVTKIALGHHRDDIVETLFLNIFFGGKMKAMPPKLRSEDGRHIVIRPLAYVAERDIERYARAREFPIIPCNLCGSQENAQRRTIKRMLAEWEREHPGRTESIFSALRSVEASHLADPALFDFAGLRRD